METIIIALLSAALTGVAVWFYASAKLAAQFNERMLTANNLASELRTAQIGELSRAQEQVKHLTEQMAVKATEVHALQEQMKEWVENTVNRVAKETSVQLNTTSQESLAGLLNPMKERLANFEKKVEEVYGHESRERIGLKAQIELAMQMNQQTNLAANNLTSALKGDAKKRGNWGEVTLENILRESGLSENDYITQGRDLDLKDENGRRQMPDIIIKMPQGKHIVIDSKVTLVSYLELCAAEDETRASLQQQYIASVKRHVDDLASKKYQENDKLIAHDFVLMFIPIESALAVALDNDGSLQSYAWSKRIALVGPSSLMMTLHTLASIWQGEKLERNANEIAREAAGLYDKVRLVVETLNKVGKNIEDAQANYQKAVGQLASGPGNVVRKLESFRQRGISVDKPIAALDFLPTAETAEITD